MDETNTAILQLTKKQRADRQFLLSRLEAAFSKVSQLETEHGKLRDELEGVREDWRKEREEKEQHARQISAYQAHLEQVFGRLESLEKLVSANPYLAFSRAANSPKAQEDPFNVDYLAHPTSLAKEASFAFNMPHMPPISDHSQSAQNENATTWDLLNLGEDLPPMSNTIRQSFFDGPQEAKPQPWNQTNGNLSTNISQSDLTSHRADSLTSSENILNSRAEIASQSNNSRVMSTSSLPLLENTGANSTNYPIISPSESNIGTPLQNSQEIVGHPVQLSPDSLGYPQYPQHITTHHVPAENIGYPPLFQPSPHEMEISQSAPPTQTSIPEARHTTSFSAQINRRKASIKGQKMRFEQMCEHEANNVEQEIVRSNVFEALSKAGEMLKTTENCMSEAEHTDDELGRILSHGSISGEKSEAQRGIEFRATKSRNNLESAYSRLCSSLDYATIQQNTLTTEQKAQRSGSSAMKSLKTLLGRKGPENAENQEEPQPTLPSQQSRDNSQRPNLARNSGPNPAGKLQPGSSFTSPLLTAVDRMSQRQINVSPQRGSKPEAPRIPAHRRTVSDTPLFPPTPDPQIERPAKTEAAKTEIKNGKMSEAELLALINHLEERRLALYRS